MEKRSPASATRTRRLEFDLTEEAFEVIDSAARSDGRTTAGYVQRAVNLDLFLRRNAREDGTIIIDGPNGKTRVILN